MDEYAREMMDLKTLVTRTLEKKGVLAKIRGSYTLQMKLLGENNEELSCITFGFSIGFIPAVADT